MIAHSRRWTDLKRRLLLGQFVRMQSDIFQIAQVAPPFGPCEWLAPIVGDPHDFSVFELADGDVPIHATITVICVLLNYDHIAARMPPRDAKLEILKMRLHLRDTRLSAKKFSTLWPPSHSAVGQRRAE
jgi:hypothetical protein